MSVAYDVRLELVVFVDFEGPHDRRPRAAVRARSARGRRDAVGDAEAVAPDAIVRVPPLSHFRSRLVHLPRRFRLLGGLSTWQAAGRPCRAQDAAWERAYTRRRAVLTRPGTNDQLESRFISCVRTDVYSVGQHMERLVYHTHFVSTLLSVQLLR